MQVRPEEKVYDRMLRASAALTSAGIAHAVVGGNAVATWVETVDKGAGRGTPDVDILIARSDTHRAIPPMRDAGFGYANVHGIAMFVDLADPHPARNVHLIYAGECVGRNDLYPAPALEHTVVRDDSIPVLGLLSLLIMKLVANRSVDRAHIIDLRNVDLVTPELIENVPSDLRPRLTEILTSELKYHTHGADCGKKS